MSDCRFSIHFYKDCVLHAADFEWGTEKGDPEGPAWTESDYDGVGWHQSPLSEDSYNAILKRFGLDDPTLLISPSFEEIQCLSPADLIGIRRKLEAEKGLNPITAMSDLRGKRVRAEEVGYHETADA